MLKLMTEKGLLVSEGYGRGTRYVLPINGIDILREEPSNVATSGPNVATSKDANVATSAPNVATSVKKKMSREELQELILQNCQEWILFIRQFIINHTLHFVGDKMQCTVKSIFNYC